MALHAARQPESPEFEEAQRLVRELLRTAGLEKLDHGRVTLNIVHFQLQEIVVAPAERRVRLGRRE